MKKSEILYYVQKRKEGWEISQVRKELESQGYDKEDVFFYLNDIDDAYVKSINDKSDLTLNNISLRIAETIIGTVILLIGIQMLASCILFGPSLLALLIGGSLTPAGYYYAQKGLSGIKRIKNATQEKIKAEKERQEDVLD